jgi:hypothetical protein
LRKIAKFFFENNEKTKNLFFSAIFALPHIFENDLLEFFEIPEQKSLLWKEGISSQKGIIFLELWAVCAQNYQKWWKEEAKTSIFADN